MSTVEKLFVQIFERKNRIVEQVKHQTDSFDHHLASKLIIEGFNPPPWLLIHNFQTSSEDPKELKKEDLISGLLLPRQLPTIPYHSGHYSLHNKPVVRVNTGEFSDGILSETHASNKGFYAGDGQTVGPQCHNNDAEIPVSGTLEPGPSATSSPNQIEARISNIYSEPEQSLARIQRSKPRQKALELRNSSKQKSKGCLVANNDTGIYCGKVPVSKIAFQLSNHFKELSELVQPSNIDNEHIGEREANTGDCQSPDKGGNIYSGRVTRSRSSSQQLNSANNSSKPAESFHIAKGGSGRCALSTGKTMQHPALVNALRNPSDNTSKIQASKVAKMKDCHFKGRGSFVYSGRITRSRSSSEKANFVDDSSKLDSSSNIVKEDSGIQAEAIPNSMQWPDHVNESLEIVKTNDINNGSCEIKEVTEVDTWSRERGRGVYCGRITRSRSSCRWPNFLGKFSELECSSGIAKECKLAQSTSNLVESSEPVSSIEGDTDSQNSQGMQMSIRSSSPRQRDLELPAENAQEQLTKGNIADEYGGRSSSSFASSRAALRNTLNRLEGLELLNGSAARTNILPCEETNNVPKQESWAASAADTRLASDEPFVSQSVCSESNLDGASLKVGFEVLVSRPPSDLDIFVKPKQLDFDGVEDCSLNEASVPAPIKKKQNTSSSGRRCRTSVEPAESPDRILSINHGNSVPSLKKQLLEEQEILSKEEEAQTVSSEAIAEERVEVDAQKPDFCHGLSASRTSNRPAAPSINKTTQVSETANTQTLECNIISELNHSVASEIVRKSSHASPLKTEEDSDLINVDADMRMDVSSEEVGKLDLIGHAKMISEDRISAATLQDSVVEFHAVSMNGKKSHSRSQKIKSCNIQFQNAKKVTLLGSYSDEEILGDSKSTEHQSTEKSMQSGRSFSFAVESSLPQSKRRRVESLTDVLSASPNLRGEAFQRVHGDNISKYLDCLEGNSETLLKSPHLHISRGKEVGQSNASECPDGEMDLHLKRHMEDRIEYAPMLQVVEGKLSLEGRVKNVNPPLTFQNEQESPALVSGLKERPSSDFQEKVGEEDGTNVILDVIRQCAAEESQGFLHHDDDLDPENLTCIDERTIWKSNFQLEDDGFYSHCSAGSPHNQYLDLVDADQTRPVFEGFVMQEGNRNLHMAGDGISFDKSELPTTSMVHACVLEQLCLSASMHTPLPHFSTYKFDKRPNFYQSVPNGLLECKDLHSTLLSDDDAGKQLRASYSSIHEKINHTFNGSSNFDHLPFTSTPFAWNISKPYTSPVAKLWGGSTSSSGSSDKRPSSNPELTCFPIEEDPSISEETERQDDVDDVLHEGISSRATTASAKREPLGDVTEEYPNRPASVSAAETFSETGGLDSVNRDTKVPWTQTKGKEKLQNLYESKTRCTNEKKENCSLSVGKNGVKGATGDRFNKPKLSGKNSLRKGCPSFSERESKLNNIVSNITSFVPLVQRTQAAAVVTGKRDVKVKALEAAEAARRLEEKRENERKMKKEALKLERARLEQENLKQLELKKKKKEEERKKKEAEMAARKRIREEEERKEKEAKRKRTEETRRQQRENEQKLRAEKEKEKERRRQATSEKMHERKEVKDEVKINEKIEKGKEEGKLAQEQEPEPRTTMVSTTDVSKMSIVLKDSEALGDHSTIGKVTGNLDKAAENNLVANTCQERSYEMSPYQSSDDEEEEEDDMPTKKFMPSWASTKYLAIAVSSQQKADPSMIFPPESFCSINEVLLSRKLQQK